MVETMPFAHENTWGSYASRNAEGELNVRFERAVETLVEELKAGPREFANYIGGASRSPASFFDAASPVDHDIVLGRFPKGTAQDASDAMQAAAAAFDGWRRTDLSERLRIMRRAADIIRKEKLQLAALLALSNGKVRREAVGEVDMGVDYIEYYAMEMERNRGYDRDMPGPSAGEGAKNVFLPYGPWAVICPFNFPFGITMTMLAGALMTGNTTVLKPASLTPWAVYALYDVMVRAGVPEGAINLVAGSGAVVGETLVKHPRAEGVIFTGSRDVGYRILSHNAQRRYPIPVILELGGKNAAIVSGKADLIKAARGVASSAFGYSGQKCVACSRVYVQRSIAEEFEGMLAKEAEAFRVGDPRSRESRTGPVIHEGSVRSFERASSLAMRDGRVLAGGKRLTEGGLAKGCFVAPTVVAGLPDDHELITNELFLPFVCVQRYDSLHDAMAQVNAVPYGLTGGIFSEERAEVDFFFDNIQCGMAFANGARGATNGAIIGTHSFGGWKASGSTGRGSGDIYYLMQFLRQQGRAYSR
jgi:1-pyrroline-5-carboxylate dehydrogenase